MTDRMNRRDFLKTTAGAGAILMAGGIMSGEKNAHGAVRIPEVDSVLITIITDNYYDALRPDVAITKRFRTQPGKWMHSEHGLAYYIETVSQGKSSSFMFDYGLDAPGVKRNMDVLGLDVGKVAGFGLSHGHFDHWGAFTEMLAMTEYEKVPPRTSRTAGGCGSGREGVRGCGRLPSGQREAGSHREDHCRHEGDQSYLSRTRPLHGF
jgi:hypothetical protein